MPNVITKVLIKGRQEGQRSKRRGYLTTNGECSDAATSQGIPAAPKARGAKEQAPLGDYLMNSSKQPFAAGTLITLNKKLRKMRSRNNK